MDSIPVQTTEGSSPGELQSRRAAPRPSREERNFRMAVSAVFQETRLLAARLRSLQAINPGSSPAFLSAMRHTIVQYAAHEAGVRMVQRRLYLIYFYTFLLAYLLAPVIILRTWLGLRLSLEEWISVYVIYGVSVGVLLIVMIPVRLISRRNLEELIFPWRWTPQASKRKTLRRPTHPDQLQWRDFAAIFWVILVAGFSGYFFWQTVAQRAQLFTSNESMAFVPAFFFWSFWLGCGVLFLIVGSTILYLRRRGLNASQPLAVICIRLLEALSLLERKPEAWGEADFKQAVVQKLEEAALRMEFDMPRLHLSGDPATEAWLAQSLAGIARSLREQKKRILLPEAGARQALVEYLARELPHAAAGDLGSLEQSEEAAPAARRMGALKRLGGFLAAILKGSLPLLALWLIQQSPIAIQSNLVDYGFVLAAIYLLFSVLSEVDPLYRDKIGAVQELLNLTSRK